MIHTKPVRFRHDDALTRVSRDEFHRLIATGYRKQGYVVEHADPGTIDMTLFRGPETVVVQCRHWVAQQVPHTDVHQLIGAMHTAGATSAIVITSGEFTHTAIAAAAKFRHVKLIDGMAIRAMLGKVAEPALPPLSLDDLPWETPGPKPASKAPVIAAVAAVVVMGMLLCTLYGVYIHEIQRAQMDAMRAASQRGADVAQNAPVTQRP
jgi:hypothetical protein